MNQTWESIADALRNEISECGRLLQLFDEQQRCIIRGEAGHVLDLSHSIQEQTGALDVSRRQREEAVSAFALANGQAAGATLRSLLPFCSVAARPLLEELIANVNLLIYRVRRGSEQSHRLLGHMVEAHQELMRRLRPDAFTKTYAPNGRVSVAALRPSPSVKTAG
jgi:hypothetical protein